MLRVILEPEVFPVLVPFFVADTSRYQLPEGGTHSERGIAMAGKVCYDSYGADGRPIYDHIKTLIESKHGSVLEHANVSLFIGGISRACSHEIVRHRAGFAFSQRSTRYTAENDAAMVLEPFLANLFVTWGWKWNEVSEMWQPNLDLQSGDLKDRPEIEVVEQFIVNFAQSLNRYAVVVRDLEILLKDDFINPRDLRKAVRGKARNLLPHSLETRMVMTGNLRAWRHFIEQRSSRYAEPEIRRLSNYIFNVLHGLAPTVFEDYVPYTDDEGLVEYATSNRKA